MIYLVNAIGGEYSDWSSTTIAGFDSHEAADKFIVAVEAIRTKRTKRIKSTQAWVDLLKSFSIEPYLYYEETDPKTLKVKRHQYVRNIPEDSYRFEVEEVVHVSEEAVEAFDQSTIFST